VCYLDVEYVDNLLLQCDKCHIIVHMNCYGVLERPDGKLWLCSMCVVLTLQNSNRYPACAPSQVEP
jgi:hypothetical protein